MQDDLVEVYAGQTLMQAQLLSDRLEAEGIRSFIDNTDSPLDGLITAEQMKIVRVLPADAERASHIVSQFQAEERHGSGG